MAQEYTMTEAGLSPATSPEYRAAFKRAKRLFDASQRRPSFAQGAAIVVSEDVEPGMPKRPIPCVYPATRPSSYPAKPFDVERDYAHLYDIAWTKATRDTLVIVYRGADGGEGTVRMKMPMPEDHNAVASFNEMKSDYLRKLTGGSGPVDTRTVVDALREMDTKAPKVAKVAKAPKVAKVAPVAAAEPEPVRQATRDDAARSRVVYLESVVAELRDEVFRLTAELNDARECADTDAADALRARETVAELRAEVNGLRYLRPKVDTPPVVLFNPIARV